MSNSISNSADISKENCSALYEAFNEHYSQENSPASFFNIISNELLLEFYEKTEMQCRQVLLNGYKKWAYQKYRIDQNGEDGVMNLNSDVQAYLLKSSPNESFVNLKEVFRNGSENINRNIRSTIFRVLAANREKTVIDRLLRRIEDLVENETSQFSRSRGPKKDYFTLTDKFPEQRDPSNEEIEVVISKIGGFREEPARENALQAPRIYNKEILSEMFYIICDTLDTDVTPNTLEVIFLDLIPGYLPPDFVSEQAFRIYGHINFPMNTGNRILLSDLDQQDQLLVKEAVKECLEEVSRLGIQGQLVLIKEHLNSGNLRINTLSNLDEFENREEVEDVLERIGAIANKIFSTLDEDIAEIAFSEFFETLT